MKNLIKYKYSDCNTIKSTPAIIHTVQTPCGWWGLVSIDSIYIRLGHSTVIGQIVCHMVIKSCVFRVPRQLVLGHILQTLMSLSLRSRENTCSSYLKNDYEIRSQFCTCHDSWAVVSCAKLWPWFDDQNRILGKKFEKDFKTKNIVWNGSWRARGPFTNID